ncbi:MAG: type IV-A pilus assembly ATPase PilB [candidate division Zixibacteria bacterium]|nr:type IV-A pilus assembly ATPase PilB [candidate division Zixibacteria bacterium]MDH4034207.1 type IV-A pilus assembly ATPase PilB [candidate division Zixibacteria bacterium]
MSAELGAMLVKAGKITPDQVDEALEIVKKDSLETFQSALVKVGAVDSEDEIADFVGKHLKIGALRLTDVELNPEVVKLIPLDIARKFKVIAVSKLNRTLLVAISDPNNIYVLDAVKFITGCTVQPVISPEKAIEKAIETYYVDSGGLSEMIKGLEEDPDLEVVVSEEEASESDLLSAIQDKPLVKLVDSILYEAIRMNASDIHIETYEKRIRVRYRIDGDLKEMAPLPFKYRSAIVSRVKIMAELDISERRLPQDGRIKIKIGGRTVDLRVSVLPTIFGEKVVMRILDPQALKVDLTKLGFREADLDKFDKAIHLPFGIVLVTGPTGSGKTTTLYSALKQINQVDVNIMTAEDPVEFNFDGINQVAVRSQIGLTFAASLRSFLRQDPDIVMVGEIRDGETAEIAIRAALTGHLVFSTLHTNDAPSSINRLLDMGVPFYLVSSATKLIMAQRMMRKICQNCKEEVNLTKEQVDSLGVPSDLLKGLRAFKGVGCADCNETGLAGRTGIYEVMPVTPAIESLILNKASDTDIRKTAMDEGMHNLRMCAVEKLKAGIVSIDEVFAVTSSI